MELFSIRIRRTFQLVSTVHSVTAMTFDCQYSTNERLTYKFVTVFIVTENRNELVTINLHRVAF